MVPVYARGLSRHRSLDVGMLKIVGMDRIGFGFGGVRDGCSKEWVLKSGKRGYVEIGSGFPMLE